MVKDAVGNRPITVVQAAEQALPLGLYGPVKGGHMPAWRFPTPGTKVSLLNALSVRCDDLRHHAPGSVPPLMIELVVLAGIVAVIFVQLMR